MKNYWMPGLVFSALAFASVALGNGQFQEGQAFSRTYFEMYEHVKCAEAFVWGGAPSLGATGSFESWWALTQNGFTLQELQSGALAVIYRTPGVSAELREISRLKLNHLPWKIRNPAHPDLKYQYSRAWAAYVNDTVSFEFLPSLSELGQRTPAQQLRGAFEFALATFITPSFDLRFIELILSERQRLFPDADATLAYEQSFGRGSRGPDYGAISNRGFAEQNLGFDGRLSELLNQFGASTRLLNVGGGQGLLTLDYFDYSLAQHLGLTGGRGAATEIDMRPQVWRSGIDLSRRRCFSGTRFENVPLDKIGEQDVVVDSWAEQTYGGRPDLGLRRMLALIAPGHGRILIAGYDETRIRGYGYFRRDGLSGTVILADGSGEISYAEWITRIPGVGAKVKYMFQERSRGDLFIELWLTGQPIVMNELRMINNLSGRGLLRDAPISRDSTLIRSSVFRGV